MAGGQGSMLSPPPPQEQVVRVRVSVSEAEKLTPQLLAAAELASGQPAGSAAAENLNLLSQEWATKVSPWVWGCGLVTSCLLPPGQRAPA